MDIIQRTILLMDNLVKRIKSIAKLLSADNSNSGITGDTSSKIFWIFNW